MAWYWCQSIGTPYENHFHYRANFFSQFTERIRKEYPQVKDLAKIDFTAMKLIQER